MGWRKLVRAVSPTLVILMLTALTLTMVIGVRHAEAADESTGLISPMSINQTPNDASAAGGDIGQGATSDGNGTSSGDTNNPVSPAAQPESGVSAPSVPSPQNATPTPSASGDAQGPTPTAKHVGIQAGHWKIAELPNELAGLRTATGTSGSGVAEWQLNLDIANRVAALLEAQGVSVDVLPATVPVGYKADAFVALHADGDLSGKGSGFKAARASRSSIPKTDDALLVAISQEYQAATMLRLDPNVTQDMTDYYAFNNKSLQHSIAPTTPGVILEMGFLTNSSDRQVLLGSPETVALGIARGILRFLGINAQLTAG